MERDLLACPRTISTQANHVPYSILMIISSLLLHNGENMHTFIRFFSSLRQYDLAISVVRMQWTPMVVC